MPSFPLASTMLQQEARGLLTRLGRVRPFVLVEPMLMAAAPLPHTQSAIDGYLLQGRKRLLHQVNEYLRWLESEAGKAATPEAAQRRFTLLRLRFNAVIAQFDMFSIAITQRSENEFGVWLAGLDVVAADALALPPYFVSPPVLCYLDKGIGAAIRRARTRLPGGGNNPVALVRIPRDRMIGSGIASSLVHEVGHQAAALLDLVSTLREEIRRRTAELAMGQYWARWISEIIADFWSVARIGVASTLGLIGVLSLPRPFVFRLNQDDPHPMPWVRVHLSAAMGESLYPHPQWAQVGALWDSYYPAGGLDAGVAGLLERLRADIPRFVQVLTEFRPPSLGGRSLKEVMNGNQRQPAQLSAILAGWKREPSRMYEAAPSLTFAVLGQARMDGQLTPEEESTILAKLLTHWALKTTLDMSFYCASHGNQPAPLSKAS
jgi:hypothetical protein